MIDDLVLRWIVTGLSALSAAAWGFVVVVRHRSVDEVVRCGLHLVMAVAMAVMAWPWGAQLPATGPSVFFALAALWFVASALVSAETAPLRTVYGYHALMMLAMAWMYAFVHGLLLPSHSSAHPHVEMDMAEPVVPTGAGSPGWVAAVNGFWFVGFVASAVFWTSRFRAERPTADGRWRSLTAPAQATMAAAMSIMFGATLFQA
ncbi:DUF5134 domain-containing protein [Mycobacterium sp. 663a-19]|uniref:DUF5134 domain-containing protein n=1 Tax=Mycobacterium sp. 663a-19 TaxID=2986148 RepID=UPI002D1F21A6|nr:DUF5134 domain-containing protein [Mycobacterium sp. 663a-19]MEB3981435.1 DUF5134 domain-containing protein [Mycobacterium sp. 663a-19]